MPEQVAEQDEHEEREDEREVLLAAVADVVAHHVGDELVAELGDRLQAARHQRALAHAHTKIAVARMTATIIQRARIRERGVEAADLQMEQSLDLELLHRAMHLAYLVPNASSYAQPLQGRRRSSSLPLPWRRPSSRPESRARHCWRPRRNPGRVPSPMTTAPNPTSGRANSRGTPRPKGPRSYPPTLDTQRLSGGATFRSLPRCSARFFGLSARRCRSARRSPRRAGRSPSGSGGFAI